MKRLLTLVLLTVVYLPASTAQTVNDTNYVPNLSLAGTASALRFVATNNVLAFGADSTGLTDSTLAISNAVKNPGVVYFPSGTYLVSGIYPTNNTFLKGDGNTSILRLYAPKTNTNLIETLQNNVRIQDLYLDGNVTNYLFPYWLGGRDADFASCAIHHWSAGFSSVQNVTISGFRYAVIMDGINDINARQNAAIYAFNNITNCWDCFYAPESNHAEYVRIIGNSMRGIMIGFHNQSAANIIFEGNQVVDSGTAIDVDNPTSARGHSLYIGNIINHAQYSYIYLSGCNEASFVDNYIAGTGGGMTISSCTGVLMAHNFFQIGSFGVSGSSGVVFLNNRVWAWTPGAGTDTAATYSGNRDVTTGALLLETPSPQIKYSLSVGATTYFNASVRSQTNQVAGALTFAHCTNGVDGASSTAVRWLFNSSGSDQTLTFPIINTGVNGWRTNVYSAVPPAITNGTIMKVILDIGGPTDTLARQTNCYVKFEYYQ